MNYFHAYKNYEPKRNCFLLGRTLDGEKTIKKDDKIIICKDLESGRKDRDGHKLSFSHRLHKLILAERECTIYLLHTKL